MVASGLHQISKGGFGSIYSAKHFCLPHAEAGYGEVTPRGLHLVQHKIDCLRDIVPGHGAAHGAALMSH
ncbi:hypothetical protein [Bradyrhizobium sp. UFLA05-153]